MSTTYPVPGSEGDYPAPRNPDVRLRVVPNESMFPEWAPELGDLVQRLVDAGEADGISVDLDTSDRTRPGEERGGASPLAGLALVLLGGAGGRLAAHLGELLLDAAVAWLRTHIPGKRNYDKSEGVGVALYGPDGEIIKRVRVFENGDIEDR